MIADEPDPRCFGCNKSLAEGIRDNMDVEIHPYAMMFLEKQRLEDGNDLRDLVHYCTGCGRELSEPEKDTVVAYGNWYALHRG